MQKSKPIMINGQYYIPIVRDYKPVKNNSTLNKQNNSKKAKVYKSQNTKKE